MSLDLDGNLYDYHGGIEDLKAGKSKFVGNTDARIQEDYLRILRYFRFQGRMDVPDWDKDTLDAIARNADGLQKISGERIWMEFAKIITGNHVVDILSKMKETGVLDQIGISAPSLAEVKRVAENTDVPSTILAVFAKNEEDVDRIAAQWKLSAHERETMRFIVQNRDKKLDEKTAKMMWTDKKVKNHHVIELAKYLGKQNLVDMLENWQTPTFPVTGKDLQAVGIKPGPAMGQILAKLEAKWKESGYTLDKDQLLGMI
jgi:tRNA nucleotidyltransferase (CCA-adding enzyme)